MHQDTTEEIPLSGPNGEGDPAFTAEKVAFNNGGGEYCESFFLSAKSSSRHADGFAFVKTRRLPYDTLVCACLLAAHSILGYGLSSDGDASEWSEGCELFQRHCEDETLKSLSPEDLYERAVSGE